MNSSSGRIIEGGNSDEADLYIAPTIIVDVAQSDAIMQDEIFGPLLPIVIVDNFKTAIDFVNAR